LWVGAGLVVFIVVMVFLTQMGKVAMLRNSGFKSQPFENLMKELKEDNAKILAELSAMTETLNAINKMLRDVQ
jgi:hypothetical protein